MPQPDAADSPGRARQAEIFRAGALGRRPAVPVGVDELERAARRRLSRRAWAYVAGGAGAGRTMARNRAAFERWDLVPRTAHGVTARTLATNLLGTPMPAPVLLAPIGAADLVVHGSDLSIARAAASLGVPFVVSNQACHPIEQIASVGGAPLWAQLYWNTDERYVDSYLARAEAAGARALVVTLDTTVLGWRPQDLTLGSLPFARGIGIAQYTSDPSFMAAVEGRPASRLTRLPARQVTAAAVRTVVSIARHHPGKLAANLRSAIPRAAVETFLETYSNPGLRWEHLATLRDRTRLPVVLKGVLHPDDARRAVDLGVDAIVVSNHGGRQVDNAIASLDALIDIREAIGPDLPLLLDSGVRTGADVLVALALGADAVLLGRPYVYGLAVSGQRGVEEVVGNLIAELDITMALCGVGSVADVDRRYVREHRP